MATTRLTVQSDWDATARITASADTAVVMTNTEPYDLRFAITDNDTAPAFAPTLGHVLTTRTGERQIGLSLKSGERLWLAIPAMTSGTITVTEGAA